MAHICFLQIKKDAKFDFVYLQYIFSEHSKTVNQSQRRLGDHFWLTHLLGLWEDMQNYIDMIWVVD